MDKYFQGFADKTSFVFDALFPHVVAGPPTPVARTPRRSTSGRWPTTTHPSGSTAPTRASRSKTSKPCRPITASQHRLPPDSTRCHWSRTMANPELGAGHGAQLAARTDDEWPGAVSPVAWWKPAWIWGDRGRFGGRRRPGARPGRHPGVHPPGYRMPIVRHFLLTVGSPAQAWRQLGRLVSGAESEAPQITTAEDWHVGFVLGTGGRPGSWPTPQARLLPQHRYHVAWVAGAGDRRTRPHAIVQVIRCVHRRSRGTSGAGR